MGSKAALMGRGEFRTETRVLRAAAHPQAALHNNQTGTKNRADRYTRAATPLKRRAHQRIVDGLLSVANQNKPRTTRSFGQK